MRVIALVAATAGAAALVASSSGSTQATRNPCLLVKKADAKRVMAKPVGSSLHEMLGIYDSCAYGSTDHRTHISLQTRALSRSDFAKTVHANPAPRVRVNGIGTEAWFVGLLPLLLVWKNGTEVSFLATGVPNARTTEKAMGRTASPRL